MSDYLRNWNPSIRQIGMLVAGSALTAAADAVIRAVGARIDRTLPCPSHEVARAVDGARVMRREVTSLARSAIWRRCPISAGCVVTIGCIGGEGRAEFEMWDREVVFLRAEVVDFPEHSALRVVVRNEAGEEEGYWEGSRMRDDRALPEADEGQRPYETISHDDAARAATWARARGMNW